MKNIHVFCLSLENVMLGVLGQCRHCLTLCDVRHRTMLSLSYILHETSPTCHFSFTLTLQHDHFDLLMLTFLLNPVSELHLLLVASDLLDHEFGTLSQMTSNLLPLSPRSDPDSKLTSSLQLVKNWPPSDLSAPLIRRHTRFCYCLTLCDVIYRTCRHCHVLLVVGPCCHCLTLSQCSIK